MHILLCCTLVPGITILLWPDEVTVGLTDVFALRQVMRAELELDQLLGHGGGVKVCEDYRSA